MERKSRTQVLIAIIGVVGTIAVTIIANWDKLLPHEDSRPVLESDRLSPGQETIPDNPVDLISTELYKQWPMLGEERFSGSETDWFIGRKSTTSIPKFDSHMKGGRYQWEIEFTVNKVKWISSPYSSAVDIFVAVDFRFVSYKSTNVAAGIQFGEKGKSDYTFLIMQNGKYEVTKYDGEKYKTLIDWTEHSINAYALNRIAVAVLDSRIRLFINGKMVAEIIDREYEGGKVGLLVTNYNIAGNSIVLEFDNFELRKSL